MRYSYTVSAYDGSDPTRDFEFFGETAGGYGGVATYSVATLGAGSHSINVTYNGDTNDIASGSASLSLTVNKVTPTLTVSSAPLALIQNTPVTFTCTATYGRPVWDGAVLQIYLDGTSEIIAAAPQGFTFLVH